MPLIAPLRRQRQVGLLSSSLIYSVSSKTARITQRNSILKNSKTKINQTSKNCHESVYTTSSPGPSLRSLSLWEWRLYMMTVSCGPVPTCYLQDSNVLNNAIQGKDQFNVGGAGQKGEGSAIPDYTRVKTKLLPGSGNGKSLGMLANTCPHKPVRLWPSWLLGGSLTSGYGCCHSDKSILLSQLPYPHGPQDPALVSVQFI